MPTCNTHELLLPPCHTCTLDCPDRRDIWKEIMNTNGGDIGPTSIKDFAKDTLTFKPYSGHWEPKRSEEGEL